MSAAAMMASSWRPTEVPLSQFENIKPSTQIGRYHVLGRIAAGGMAEVWLGEYRGVGGFSKRVVLKTMQPQLTQNEQLVKMFIAEAGIAAKLEHDNIVRIFDFGENEGYYFIAMEYVAGRSLRQVGNRYRKMGKRFDTWFLARAALETCAALKYVHEFNDGKGKNLGLVHRDVSPENIMVSFTGAVKLLDFGVVAANDGVGMSDLMVGKCRYMAPERIGSSVAFPPGDIFSLGVILYEYSTGRVPFDGDNETVVLRRILETTPPRPREIVPDLPEEFDDLVMRALARDPVDRYGSADALAVDLRRFLQKSDLEALHRPIDRQMASLFGDAIEVANNARHTSAPEYDFVIDVVAQDDQRTAHSQVPELPTPSSTPPVVDLSLAANPTSIPPVALGLTVKDTSTTPSSMEPKGAPSATTPSGGASAVSTLDAFSKVGPARDVGVDLFASRAFFSSSVRSVPPGEATESSRADLFSPVPRLPRLAPAEGADLFSVTRPLSLIPSTGGVFGGDSGARSTAPASGQETSADGGGVFGATRRPIPAGSDFFRAVGFFSARGDRSAVEPNEVSVPVISTEAGRKAAKLFERGFEHYSNKSYQAAFEAWREAAELDPENRAYQTNLKRLERALKKEK